MKKILSVLIMLVFFVSAFAQDLSEALQAKNAGNAAYKSKDYIGAIENWEKYLNSGDEGVAADANTKKLYNKSFKYAAESFFKAKDYSSAIKYYEKYSSAVKKEGSVVYKMAYCATKLGQNDVALSKYQESISMGYKEDVCNLYIANIYKKAGDEEKMKSTLIDALAKYPDSKSRSKMASMLTTPMLKEAAIPFNEANELAKSASSSDPTAYLSNMAKAVTKFKTAIPLFEKVLQYDPSNEQANNYIKNCKDNIKSYNDYKASLEKK